MERDPAHRPRDRAARSMTPGVTEARSEDFGDTGRQAFRQREDQTRASPSRRQGGASAAIRDAINRQYDQARHSESVRPDHSIDETRPVQPAAVEPAEIRSPSETQSHFAAGAGDSRTAASEPHSPRDKIYNRRFYEMGLGMESNAAAPTAPPPAANTPADTDGVSVIQKQQQGSDVKPASVVDAPRTPTKRPSKLQFSKDEASPSVTPSSDKLKKASAKAGYSAAKLDAAKNNLPKKYSVKISKVVNTGTGKPMRALHFETEVKSKQAHLKGAVVTRPAKAGFHAAVTLGHRKIQEVEHENVGTQAAHRGATATESGLRSAYRFHKTSPYRKVERLGRKTTKLNLGASYQQALAENPKLKSSLFSRIAQRRRIKREYAKAVREAQKTARRVKKTGSLIEQAARSTARLVTRHPVISGIIAIVAILVLLVSSTFSACSDIVSGGIAAIAASSYLAEDMDINDAELVYTLWETDMRVQIANTERDHPGFDEYVYNVSDIEHDPFELMAYLTAVYQDFTYDAIAGDLRALFEEQYELTFMESVEIRYRTVTKTDPVTGLEHQIQEAYNWHVLTVTLSSWPLGDLVWYRMDGNQQRHFLLLMQTKGNRQYVGNPFGFNWLPYVSSYYGYRISPITGTVELHQGVDIAVPRGTAIYAGLDGTATFAGYDSSYGNCVLIQGADGVEARYAHCDTLTVLAGQTVSYGDVIGAVGSTGDATGLHLHFEVIKDGQTLNPLYFAVTGDDGSGYIPPGSLGEESGVSSSSIVAVAASQIGNVGGRPYWSWYGNTHRVAWCACFVSWCANQCGYISAGIIPKFESCKAGIQWFQSRGQWRAPGYVPAPGTLIFFDWTNDGVCEHVGIVEYVDGNTVHTIEGNSGDKVARRAYKLSSRVIFGYAVPAYE